jgi:hypothetical protein
MLIYRDENHSYTLDGRPIPGITRILSDLGAFPGSDHFTEESRQRGQAAHLACQLADQHCPQADSVDEALERLDLAEALLPFLAGYLKFRRENRYHALRWETPACSRRLRVGGRPDSDGQLDGQHALVDVKSWASQGAKPKHSAEVQTAAYAIMLAEEAQIPDHRIQRYVLKLPGDGNYRLYHCTDAMDLEEATWCALLWHRWHDRGIFKSLGDPQLEFAIGE